jgi:hypothetical protein
MALLLLILKHMSGLVWQMDATAAFWFKVNLSRKTPISRAFSAA